MHVCDLCKYSTTKKSSFDNHCKSKKHISLLNKVNELNNLIFAPNSERTANEHKKYEVCSFCNSNFSNKSSLKRHQSTCSNILKQKSFLEKENKNLREKNDELNGT